MLAAAESTAEPVMVRKLLKRLLKGVLVTEKLDCGLPGTAALEKHRF